ncbi:MAG: hypothetical protein FWD25_05670 [Clostridia bacterium]|nr:hypothetical protein [Clostridia bacterium]
MLAKREVKTIRNRTNFHFTPAQGSLVYAPQQPAAAPRSTDIVNYDRLLMLLFFIVIPFLWIISLMLTGFLWLVFLGILGTVSLLWLKKGFTARGRLSMTALYAVFAVVVLTSLLQGSSGPSVSSPRSTMPPIQAGVQENAPAPTPANIQAAAIGSSLAIEAEGGGAEPGDIMPSMASRSANTACQQVLTQFLEYWRGGMVADMVPLTAHSWQTKANYIHNGAEQSLYAQISGRRLVSYEMGEPTGTENNTSRSITVTCNLIQKDEPRIVTFQALILNENGEWLVDPNSLMNGTRVDVATPAPGEAMVAAATEQPTPTPKPTAKPKSNLKLYYNARGGEFYHLEAKCKSVNPKFFPLKSFTYGNINRSPQRNLSPCTTCNAPSRP